MTFECEPGTLQKHKLETLRKHGITRLSLGVENFKPEILQYNGRAHLRRGDLSGVQLGPRAGLPADQHRPDCRHGRRGLGQLEALRRARRSTLVPIASPSTRWSCRTTRSSRRNSRFSATTSRRLAVADWPTKRAWVQYAFDELCKAGYSVSSATTVVKDPARTHFVYREASLARGRHVRHRRGLVRPRQRRPHSKRRYLGVYIDMLSRDQLPLGRAFPTTPRDRLIREIVLQLKTGRLDAGYFRKKYSIDIYSRISRRVRATGTRGLADP